MCRSCHRLLERGAVSCTRCGAASRGGASGSAFELVLPDGARVPLSAGMTIGRAPENSVVLASLAVSRVHARILDGGRVADAGSHHGTVVDGTPVTAPEPLRDGSRLRLGDTELVVERRRAADAAGRTVVAGALGTAGPRLAPGCLLKRLPAGDGPRRWVLTNRTGSEWVRLGDGDAALVQRLDGTLAPAALLHEGGGRALRLLAELGGRGLLDGVGSPPAAPRGRLGRWFAPRIWRLAWLPGAIDAAYRRGGWRLFTAPALVVLAALAAAGPLAFAISAADGQRTPLVVADSLGLGGIIFVAARFGVVAAHELAHGLTLAALGRRVRGGGLKLVLVFPYGFVDTSSSWLEPRGRRMAVTAAGPVSDLVLGGAAALAGLAAPHPLVSAVLFQLALAAYVGAAFNLNPFLDRDGYHVLSDALCMPGLRRRARAQLRARLSGAPRAGRSRVLTLYAVAMLGASIATAVVVGAIALRGTEALRAALPADLAWVTWLPFAGALAAGLLPVIVTTAPPLWTRLRRRAERDGRRHAETRPAPDPGRRR